MNKEQNTIRDKSYDSAMGSIKLYKSVQQEKLFAISSQFIKSATSIGANVEEALAGQSLKDFTAKMSIASKEARETNYWLRLIRDTHLVNNSSIELLLNDSEELIKILTSIVKTSSSKAKNSKLSIHN
jgi:four helix bundle protein